MWNNWYTTFCMPYLESLLAICTGITAFIFPSKFATAFDPSVSSTTVLVLFVRMAANGMILAGFLKYRLLAPHFEVPSEVQWAFLIMELGIKFTHWLATIMYMTTAPFTLTLGINLFLSVMQLLALACSLSS